MLYIVGAGMAGLLAANILRRHSPFILERQGSLPNNHHAVLRFRTDDVSQQLRIPFRKVRVFKSCDEPDPVRAAMLYSRKVTGRYEMRSLLNLAPAERFIAPPDLVSQMAEGLNIQYGEVVYWFATAPDPIISTIPMEALMDELGFQGPRPTFVSRPGWTINATIHDCDAFVTRYYAKHVGPVYRASITGDQLIIEGVGDPPQDDFDPVHCVRRVLMDFGINGEHDAPKLHTSRYAKIGELSDADRRLAKDFMFWASHEHRIFSLGRFATWRAGLLLDDLVNDIIQIERMITGSAYDTSKELRK